jgi:hypothetical protein
MVLPQAMQLRRFCSVFASTLDMVPHRYGKLFVSYVSKSLWLMSDQPSFSIGPTAHNSDGEAPLS